MIERRKGNRLLFWTAFPSIITLVLAGIGVWWSLNNRVAGLETRISVQEAVSKDTNDSVHRIEATLDRFTTLQARR